MSLHPHAVLPTHTVANQVPPLVDYDLATTDPVLMDGLRREGAAWAQANAQAFGEALGRADILEAGHLANKHGPELVAFDRYGHRIDEVRFHPSYHTMFSLGAAHGVHSLAWTAPQPGGHVAHAALEYLLGQVEAGVCCPLTMTYAIVPVLREDPTLARDWLPGALSTDYDPRMVPADGKRGLTFGMAMTEKQGGSDVRANTTRAVPDVDGAYRLTGHKWFCSAPMSDAFLTLAQTDAGLSCFFVPRWCPDGSRNRFFVQRLKDKCGNKSNASSEIEYHDTWALPVGEPGRGVATILDMVHHTRLDCTVAAAGLGRRALVEAIHHAMHRKAFGHRLIEQPLMRNVLADLSLEVEANLRLALRVARAYDEAETDPQAARLGRIGVAVAKYWTNKRCVTLVGEAMECLGGAGYVEEGPLARLFREAPLNGIWEGSGNVICLDVLRAGSRDPSTTEALVAELRGFAGLDARLDAAIDRAVAELSDPEQVQYRARRLVESLALAWQGGLMLRDGTPAAAEAFVATRLGGAGGVAFGTLPRGVDTSAILRAAWPAVDA